MLSANEIRQALKGDRDTIANTYQQLTGKEIDRKCGDCISDARIYLNTMLRELEREGSPVHLYVSVYTVADQKRQSELEECLYQNQNNPHISKLIEVRDKRPTFQDFFNLFSDDAVNIIVNSDIFFDETIQLAKFIRPNQCYALTRYDWNGNGHARFLNRSDSQDAWIFRGKIKKQMFADFCLGVPGCDNRIAYEIKKAGYQIINPSRTIHALHYHDSGVRSYTVKTPAVPQPYYFVNPCALT